MPNLSSFNASQQDGSYPRPQLVRQHWCDLSGPWDFAYDDDDTGFNEGWHSGAVEFPRTITVPFPPESASSGIGDTGFHSILWYQRTITPAQLATSGLRTEDDRVLLHFGAVDYRAAVWVNDSLAGTHEGGQTPFSFDITDLLQPGRDATVKVRAEDDPHDVSQPRGKQDWLEEPHAIWYHRTSGIWQPVWIEAVPALSIRGLRWQPDVPAGSVKLDVELSVRPRSSWKVRVELNYGGAPLGSQQIETREPRCSITSTIAGQNNGQAYESLLWSPEHPRLIDAHISLVDANGNVADEVWSYLGLRSTGTSGGHFLLNDRPYYVRSVLEQGYWPDSHLAAPDAAAIHDEVQLIKDLGFNAARLHEKVEDPRFLYWTDRLGLLVWGEMGSTFEYSATAVERVTREWTDVVKRDRSHPSIVTWVPLNESWGVQHISHDPAQLHFAESLYHLTKALDPSRPVISNDGWEHATSDLLTIHDYASSGETLAARYRDKDEVRALLEGIGPAGRRMMLLDGGNHGQPVMLSEFGGISYAPDARIDTWGYSTAVSADEFATHLEEVFGAIHRSRALAGFCYTQLTDTVQEANGLTDENRKPKLPIDTIHGIVTGDTI